MHHGTFFECLNFNARGLCGLKRGHHEVVMKDVPQSFEVPLFCSSSWTSTALGSLAKNGMLTWMVFVPNKWAFLANS